MTLSSIDTGLMEFMIIATPDGKIHYSVALLDGNMIAKLGPFEDHAEVERAVLFMKKKAQELSDKYFKSERFG